MFEIEWAVEQLEGPAAGLIFRYRLFRAETMYRGGRFVKDLKYLNRDLGKVIAIDWDRGSLEDQPENLLWVPKWGGDKNDRELLKLIPLLEEVAKEDVGDVRGVLKQVEVKGAEVAGRELKERMRIVRERQGGMFGVWTGQDHEQINTGGGTALGRMMGFGGVRSTGKNASS